MFGEISGCHGQNWLYGYQSLGPILVSSADRRGAWIIRNRRPTFPSSPPHLISRYFCKDSLKTPPPPPPQHTNPLQASLLLLLHLQKFSSYHFLHFLFVFIRVSFVFTRVHSCSFVFHSCSLVFIRVPFVFHLCSLVFTCVHSYSLVFHSCFTRVHSCSFVFHSCSFVFIRVRSCSFVFRSVWCFRYFGYDLIGML